MWFSAIGSTKSSSSLFLTEGKTVNALALDEGTVVIGGCDPAVLVHDRKENEQIGGDFRVNDTGWVLAVAKDGDLIAAGGTDNAIRCWDRETGSPITNPLRGHERYVSALAVSGGLVASGSWDGTVRLWTPNKLRRISYSPQTTEYPKNPLAAVAVFKDVIVTASEWGTIRLWDAGTGEQIGKTMNEEACFMPFAVAIDSESIMAVGRMIQPFDSKTSETTEGYVSWSALADGTDFSVTEFALYRWDRATGAAIRQVIEFEPHPSLVAVTRDLLVTHYGDGSVSLLPLADGQIDHTVRGETLKMPGSNLQALTISNRTIVSGSGDGTVHVWNTDTGALLETPIQMPGPQAISALGISKRIVVAGNVDGDLQIWDLTSGLVIGTIHLGSPISGIAMDDTAIYVASFRGLVRIDWNRFNSPSGL
jgi:WD40 repeat protein